jgi:hypothetical protein
MRQQSNDRAGVLVDVILSETHYLKVAKAVTTDGHDTSSDKETVPNMGVLTSAPERPGAEMDWRVTIELSGADPHSMFDPLGLASSRTQPAPSKVTPLRRPPSHCRRARDRAAQ